jgi:hypothetical protein
MAEFRIPFVLWFDDEAPPDLTILTVPVAIAVAFHPVDKTRPRDARDDSPRAMVTEGGEIDG